MKYYLVNLGAHSLVLLVFIIILIISANRNARNKTKHSLTYFLPFAMAVIIVVDVINFTGPRYLDATSMLNHNYYSYTGTVEEVGYFNNYVVIDGESYYINPLRDIPKKGSVVRVKYTKTSHYAIEISVYENPTSVDEAADSSSAN